MKSIYAKMIIAATGCEDSEADRIEEIMRDVIFHSTLDWQTKEQLEEAAKLVYHTFLCVGEGIV